MKEIITTDIIGLITHNNLSVAKYECASSSGGKYYEITFDSREGNYKINYGSLSAYKKGLVKAVYGRTEIVDKIREKLKKGYRLVECKALTPSPVESKAVKKEKPVKTDKSVEECVNRLFD